MNSTYKNINIEQINSFVEMGEAGVKLLKELVDTFQETSAEHVKIIQKELLNQNAKEVWEAAHSLKSSSGALGAQFLSRLASEIEQLGKKEDLLAVQKKALELDSVREQAVSDLKAYVATEI